MPISQPLPLSTPGRNLVRLTLIRGIAWSGFLAAIIIGIELLQIHLLAVQLIVITIVMAALNMLTWWRLRQPYAVTDAEYLFHLLADVIGLALFFYYSGGASNPFVSYFLVPLTISAATLPWIYTWIIAAAVLSAYTFLMQFYISVPELSHASHTGISLHLLGMWLNFLLSTGLITTFVFKMAHTLRHREKMLGEVREKLMRDEQILAVATQAAGTAHELGTPLSTLAVMLKDLSREYPDDPLLQEDLALMREQVDRCKSKLQELVKQADKEQQSKENIVPLCDFLKPIIDYWKVLRPDVKYQLDCTMHQPMPCIRVDQTLEQAFLNLLNNAADASPERVDIKLDWQLDYMVLKIKDYGAGIAPEVAAKLGETFISTKEEGMGIGLFLTHATINRFQGTVKLYSPKEGGTVTEVKLPLYHSVPVA
ncbi:two-component system, sensor histidine kinase RegB [Oceanospirillum multiglobuliferum]|uniref:histidine kinase n=1 Tax=Oceanospirillum multiglobuliferum TaxID=64969 RepID=A0A1T4NBG3_9GAMM|nr:ATP-binding protein [Oceanospirillum multiglobuliferum]OPX55911.1 two-component sensor histidine kinase [Oceanospirillum multiglobuliferum]SJZ76602.1 two-component system, sensor histidine kinase RegB [Oceanospirillum multiglobuliferum]